MDIFYWCSVIATVLCLYFIQRSNLQHESSTKRCDVKQTTMSRYSSVSGRRRKEADDGEKNEKYRSKYCSNHNPVKFVQSLNAPQSANQDERSWKPPACTRPWNLSPPVLTGATQDWPAGVSWLGTRHFSLSLKMSFF